MRVLRSVISDKRFAIPAMPFWLTLLLLVTGCELVGFIGQAQAIALAIQKCDEFRLTSLQAPQILGTEWLTLAQVEARGLTVGTREPNTLVWLVTLQGRWRLEGGPAPVEGTTPPLRPILTRCIVVLDAKTGETMTTRAEP